MFCKYDRLIAHIALATYGDAGPCLRSLLREESQIYGRLESFK